MPSLWLFSLYHMVPVNPYLLWFEVIELEDPCLRNVQKFMFPENDPKGNSRITGTSVTFFPGSVYGCNPKNCYKKICKLKLFL